MTHDQPNPPHDPENTHFSRVSNTASTLAACGVLVLALVGGAYALNFRGQRISGDPADWGAFGDFVGGIANPIFSFMTIMLLAMTIIVQARQLAISSKELRLSREELELSRTELRRSATAQELSEKALKAQALAAEKTATISAINTLIAHYERQIEKIPLGIDSDEQKNLKKEMQYKNRFWKKN